MSWKNRRLPHRLISRISLPMRVRNVERLRNGGRMEQSQSAGCGDHSALGECPLDRPPETPLSASGQRCLLNRACSSLKMWGRFRRQPLLPRLTKLRASGSAKNNSSPSWASNERISGLARHMRPNGRAAQQCNPAKAPRAHASSSVTAKALSRCSSDTALAVGASRHKAGSSTKSSTGSPADCRRSICQQII